MTETLLVHVDSVIVMGEELVPRERRTLTREEAQAYTRDLQRRADNSGIDLDHWILVPGRPNDTRPGPGPRFAIVEHAQSRAREGATYGSVLGDRVHQGNGDLYTIRIHDLAGFVCANGYCEIHPPGVEAETALQAEVTAPAEIVGSASSMHTAEIGTRATPSVPGPQGALPCRELMEILGSAYPCPAFQDVCRSMRWDPPRGHIPRGFLGATGRRDEVELVLVFAEPGDPQPGDHESMEEALRHATWAFQHGQGLFHRNARSLFDLCWPGLSIEAQMRKTWLTESVLCSAEVTTGPVPRRVEAECGSRYLMGQLELFPNALVVALGSKAQQRLQRLGILHMHAYALAPPGCNRLGAAPSWHAVAAELGKRRQAGVTHLIR